MIIYPAIDMRDGKVVRLLEGDPNRQTVFSDDPVTVANRWLAEGAEWIHVVNLDGAFATANSNLSILKQITALNVNVQFGGGLRTEADVERAFDYGVQRVVLGTLATQNPAVVSTIIEKYGVERVCVAMDSKDGFVTTHGWTEKTTLTPVEFGRLMVARGVQHALYTDVNRDGSMLGVNLHGTISLARNTGLKVIASGGISKMVELQHLAHSHVVAGAVIGMALYKDEISLREAILAAREQL